MIEKIIEAIITGLIAGVFSVIGVKITIANENRQKEKELKRKEFEDKPKFVSKRKLFRSNSEADIAVFACLFNVAKDENDKVIFEYDEKLNNNDDLVFYDYEFENIGKGSITEISFFTNGKKNTSVFPLESRDYYLKNKLIWYSVLYDKGIIESHGKIKLRIGYHKDMQISSFMSSPFSIIYRDEYGNYWEQPFFDMQNKLYEPFKRTYKEYIEDTTGTTALECFEKPWMW